MRVIAAALLSLLLTVSALAAPIDTVRFSENKLIYDFGASEIRYDGLEQVTVNGTYSIPVYNQTFHCLSTEPNPKINISVIEADTILLPFSVSKFSDLTTASEPYLTPPPDNNLELQSSCSVGHNNTEIDISGEYDIFHFDIYPIQILDDNTIIFNRVIVIESDDANLPNILNAGYPDFHRLTKSISTPRAAVEGVEHGCPLGCNWLLITSSDFVDYCKDLIALKRRCGFTAEIAITDSIYDHYSGIDEAEAIRNYLIDYYAYGGQYVLLAGDEDHVPVRYTYYYNTDEPQELPYLMMMDHYYADLDGNWDADGDGVWGESVHDQPDLGAELLVGRLPFSRGTQIQDYTAKLHSYLFNPGNGDANYLNQAVFFSSDQMRDYPDSGEHYIVAAEMPETINTDCQNMAEMPSGSDLAPSGPAINQAVDAFSGEYGLINILAHGRPDGFIINSSSYNENPKAYILTGSGYINDATFGEIRQNDKVGFCYTIACDQAAYDLDKLYGMQVPSVTEQLLSQPRSGAVGMIAFTRWGWVSSSYKLMAAFYKHLFSDADGNPVLAMNLSWLDYPYYRDQIYGQNFFGDPSIKLYVAAPTQTYIETDGNFPINHSWSVRLSQNGQPLVNHSLIVTDNFGNSQDFLSDAGGYVDLPPYDANVSELTLTVFEPGQISDEITVCPGIAADAGDNDPTLPVNFELGQNYPNPFNPTTKIDFSLPRGSQTELIIYNILGRKVKTLVCGYFDAGNHEITWDGTNDNGQNVASGIYIYRLATEFDTAVKKMTLLK